MKNIIQNGIKPIKINNYNNNYQRKVIPPMMNKNEKNIFDGESIFTKKTQISNLNNINYLKMKKNISNSNLNLFEQSGKTYSTFKNDIMQFNVEEERKSLPVKNINNNTTIKKDQFKNSSRPSSEDGYKYFFDLKNIDCYLLREISDNYIYLVEDWKEKYRKCNNYLKIIGFTKYDSQPYYTVVLEHPTGGENFNDIVNLIGFYDVKLLLNISQNIYDCLSNIKNDVNNMNIMNIIFCICDIFLNINYHIKIIPPFLRKIQIIDSNNNGICQCKKSINKIMKLFKYAKNNTSLLCFGISLLQSITQSLLFKMNSFNYIINNKNINMIDF